MDSVKVILVVLSIAIVVGPLVGVLYVYRDNLSGLVLPPQIKNVLQGNQTTPSLQPPEPTGTPQYNPKNGTFTLSFSYTNPLDTTVTISRLTAQVKASDYNIILGNVSLAQPVTFQPKQTATVTTTGTLDPTAVNQIKAQNPNASSVDVSLENVSVTAGGVTLQLGEIPNVGQIPLPGGSP
jgi:hypothetical protein